jgi:hypothetical protein
MMRRIASSISEHTSCESMLRFSLSVLVEVAICVDRLSGAGRAANFASGSPCAVEPGLARKRRCHLLALRCTAEVIVVQ